MAICAIGTLCSCGNDAGKNTDSINRKPYEAVAEEADVDFVLLANNVLNTEIAAGKLAMKKGTDKKVKNLGRIIAKDFTKGHVKLLKLAAKKNIHLTDTLSLPAPDDLAQLDKYTGKDFDKAYIEYVKTSHAKAIRLCHDAGKTLFDKDIKAIAGRGLLVFQRHLETVNAMYGGN